MELKWILIHEVSTGIKYTILGSLSIRGHPLHYDFLSGRKVSVGRNQTTLKFTCFYKTSHLIFQNFTGVSRNISTLCMANPIVSRPKIISCRPMRCMKREPACLISASFCRQISRLNIYKA